MTTATEPHAYPIAGVRGLTIACQDTGIYGYEQIGDQPVTWLRVYEWTLACPHGGKASLRLTQRQNEDVAELNRVTALVARWRERQAAGFRMQYGCDCGAMA